jgi:signal transduction histidine kinase
LLARYGFNPQGGCALFQWLITDQAQALHEFMARRGILLRLFTHNSSLRFGLPADAAEEARLEQALSHLIQNAIDASPPDAPVTLTALGCGTETGIEVVDKGPGMTADFVRGALFRPFASTKNGGFGVGAYEARAIVSAMGGRIGIVTAPGEGTRMTIWLPGAEPAVARAAA